MRTTVIELSEEIESLLAELAQTSGQDVDSFTAALLEEAVKMRQVPGIYFANEGKDRRAKIAGTGLDVWEIIDAYLASDRNWERLRASFSWLSDRQLQSALEYYEAYPNEIDPYIEENGRVLAMLIGQGQAPDQFVNPA